MQTKTYNEHINTQNHQHIKQSRITPNKAKTHNKKQIQKNKKHQPAHMFNIVSCRCWHLSPVMLCSVMLYIVFVCPKA